MPSIETYCPTVLIVDDDTSCTDSWRENFHRETSVGVVVANSLGEARRLIDEADIPIDGVVADLHFEAGTDDPANDLYDGIGLLSLANARRPTARRYVLSFWADRRDYRQRTESAGLTIERWFPKSYPSSYQPGEDQLKPWNVIERDLIKERLRSNQPGDPPGDPPGDDPPIGIDDIRRSIVPPMRTYLQSLALKDVDAPAGAKGRPSYRVKKPIEVICFQEEGRVRATAQRLGLLKDGHGETVDEALEELKAFVLDVLDVFHAAPDEEVVGYARNVKERIEQYVERESSR